MHVVFSYVPGLYALDAASSPPNCDHPVCLQTLPLVLCGAQSLPVEKHNSRLRNETLGRPSALSNEEFSRTVFLKLFLFFHCCPFKDKN